MIILIGKEGSILEDSNICLNIQILTRGSHDIAQVKVI